MAGATVDANEPTVATGLHNTRRAKLAAAHARGSAGGTPLRREYQRTEAVPPVGYCGYSQPTPCGTARRISGAEPPDGSRGARVLERVLDSARTAMFTRVELTTLTWPLR